MKKNNSKLILGNTWIVIPAYNEQKNIGDVLEDVKKLTYNVIVVDDGSNDATGLISDKLGLYTLNHPVNLGKGAALRSGCDYAVNIMGAKQIVVMDSDGQHSASYISGMLDKLKEYDIVFGYRSFTSRMPFLFRFGNTVINLFIFLLYGLKLHDTQCGFRAFTSKAYNKIRWQSNDYTMESEMIAHVSLHKLKYAEKKIKTIYLDKTKGTTPLDGIKIVLDIILWRFNLLRYFFR